MLGGWEGTEGQSERDGRKKEGMEGKKGWEERRKDGWEESSE